MKPCNDCDGIGYTLADECGCQVLGGYKEGEWMRCIGRGCSCTVKRIDCETCNGTGEVEDECCDPDDDIKYEEQNGK